MAKLDPTKFRVSSALKNIIGKELITDDFIAVFELVKNSFDAHATQVDLFFEDIYSDVPRLTIWDDGKGMDREDIIKKWLFVAYSAKKEGTEDYRNKIRSNRVHAGAKGIGRFSCDRLGSNLTIYTKRKGNNTKINKLVVDWADFEQDSQEEFINIGVKHSYVQIVPYENFKYGTILEITGLRENWNREKLLKLRHSLEKLINPNQENDPHGFSIFLSVEEEEEKDSEKVAKGDERNIVNGRIKNDIFENLEIKTTKIDTIISEDGETITTTLEDRGTLIYRVVEANPYKKLLKNIKIYLFVLNRSAKIVFHKAMGIRAFHYGSVFLYKNGFRVYPFGEPGDDTLKIDHRKQQGQARFLGTRDLIGRIEVYGDNSNFQEVTSRDGGLIQNANYDALKEVFLEYAIKRLEKFTIGVIKWGNEGNLLDHDIFSPEEMKKKISDIVYNLTRSENIIDIEYNPKLIDILQDRTEKSLKTILNTFGRLAEQTDNQLVAKEIRRAQRQYKSLVKAKEEAENEAQKAKAETKKAEQTAAQAKKEAKQKSTQNLFLQSVLSQDRKDILNFHHHIGIAAGEIQDHVKLLARKIRKGELTKERILQSLQKINYHAELITSTTRFATQANFKLKGADITADIIVFIREHMQNICLSILKRTGSNLKISCYQITGETCKCKFKPIEISMILDNLLSNSKKAGATKVDVRIKKIEKGNIEISFSDNGKGILAKNADKIFEIGFTTTNGSGLGLYHIKDVLRKMGGSIELNKDKKDGTEFVLKLEGGA